MSSAPSYAAARQRPEMPFWQQGGLPVPPGRYWEVPSVRRTNDRTIRGHQDAASRENVNEDNFKNVANVEMLPMPMLPVPIEIEDWEWQHWILTTFDQVIGKGTQTPREGNSNLP